MNIIGMLIALGVSGMILGMIGGYFTGDIQGMIIGCFAGLMPFMAITQIIGYAKAKGFIALFKPLEPDEKYVWLPNKMNKIRLFIFKVKHKGMIWHKQLGIFEDKGSEFAFGNSPMGFAFPDSAYSVDFKNIHYYSIWERDKENPIEDYEDMVRKYLGETKYQDFRKKFRTGKEPDFHMIKEEIKWLINEKPTPGHGNSLEKPVFGETVDFRNRLKYLLYNYDPESAVNATERERIISMKLGMDYKEPDKYVGRAKAVVMILFAIMVVVITLSVVDLSAFFGG